MTGLWALLRKEFLEQRRSRKFLALAGLFLVIGILPPTIAFIVFEVTDEPRTAADAQDALTFFIGIVGFVLGPLLAIMVMMGSLAVERDSGTAAMTLHKPVTRLAFVTAKLVGFALTILLAMVLSATVFFLLTLLVFGDGGVVRFAGAVAVTTGYLIFLGSIAFFWSALLRSSIGAGGFALFTWVALGILLAVPKADRYLPVSTPNWAQNLVWNEEGSGNLWPAFLVAMGCMALLSVGAWAVFRRKEL